MEFYNETQIHVVGLTEINLIRSLEPPPEGKRKYFSWANAVMLIGRVLVPMISDYYTWSGMRFPYPPFYRNQFDPDFVKNNYRDFEQYFCFTKSELTNFSSARNPNITVKGLDPRPTQDLLVKTHLGIIIPLNFQERVQDLINAAPKA